MATIEIDFFELSFLAEVCIPPVPIARGMFWHRLIDKIYYDLSEKERANLFNWIQKNPRFDLNNEDCQLFYARFNPENQFEVQCFYQGKGQTVQAFRRDDKYWTARNTCINPEYIKEVRKKVKRPTLTEQDLKAAGIKPEHLKEQLTTNNEIVEPFI